MTVHHCDPKFDLSSKKLPCLCVNAFPSWIYSAGLGCSYNAAEKRFLCERLIIVSVLLNWDNLDPSQSAQLWSTDILQTHWSLTAKLDPQSVLTKIIKHLQLWASSLFVYLSDYSTTCEWSALSICHPILHIFLCWPFVFCLCIKSNSQQRFRPQWVSQASAASPW